MSHEQITKWAVETGMTLVSEFGYTRFTSPKQLQAFATLVRNTTLEEAAEKCVDMAQAVRNRTLNVKGEPMCSERSRSMDECAEQIRSLKT